jgi:hypothetical protein
MSRKRLADEQPWIQGSVAENVRQFRDGCKSDGDAVPRLEFARHFLFLQGRGDLGNFYREFPRIARHIFDQLTPDERAELEDLMVMAALADE